MTAVLPDFEFSEDPAHLTDTPGTELTCMVMAASEAGVIIRKHFGGIVPLGAPDRVQFSLEWLLELLAAASQPGSAFIAAHRADNPMMYMPNALWLKAWFNP